MNPVAALLLGIVLIVAVLARFECWIDRQS